MKAARSSVVLLLFVCVSCATLNVGDVSFEKWSPEKKAAYFMGVYNRAYDDYKVKVALPDLLPAEKEVLKAKYKVLQESYPLISLYDLSVAIGDIPSRDTELAILTLVTRLERLVIREVSK